MHSFYLFWLHHAAHRTLAYQGLDPWKHRGFYPLNCCDYRHWGHCHPDFLPLNLHKRRQDGHYLCREGDQGLGEAKSSQRPEATQLTASDRTRTQTRGSLLKAESLPGLTPLTSAGSVPPGKTGPFVSRSRAPTFPWEPQRKDWNCAPNSALWD